MLRYLQDIQGDQKVSVHLMITIQKAGGQRLFDHRVLSESRDVCSITNFIHKQLCYKYQSLLDTFTLASRNLTKEKSMSLNLHISQ